MRKRNLISLLIPALLVLALAIAASAWPQTVGTQAPTKAAQAPTKAAQTPAQSAQAPKGPNRPGCPRAASQSRARVKCPLPRKGTGGRRADSGEG